MSFADFTRRPSQVAVPSFRPAPSSSTPPFSKLFPKLHRARRGTRTMILRSGLRSMLCPLLLGPLLLGPTVWLSPLAVTPLSAQTETLSSDEEIDGAQASAFEEKILVTARRREEDQQKIPVSVVSYDADALEALPIQDLSDLSELTANLDFAVSGGFADGTSEAAVVLRGVGQVDTALFSDPGVGIYVDGVFLARSQGAVLDLVDPERVEILRGPQGTLFGKNTTGGAIQVVTRRPGNARQGRFGLTLGRFDRIDGRVSVDAPLTERLSASAVVAAQNRDGWSRSLASGQEYGDIDRRLARLALLWRPSDSLAAYITGDGLHQRESGGNQLLLGTTNTPLLDFYNQALAGAGLAPYTFDTWGTGDLGTSFNTYPSRLDVDTRALHLELEKTFRDRRLRSITAFRAFDLESASDGDGSPYPLAQQDRVQEHEQWSQELQWSGSADKLDWVLGALYFHETPEEFNRQLVLGNLFAALEAAPGAVYAPPGVPSFLCDPGPPPPGLPCFGGAGNPLNFAFFSGPGTDQFLDLETTSWAVFSELDWDLSDRLSLTVGGRFTEDRKSLAYRAVDGFGQEISKLYNEDTWDDWSGRVSLAFQARPDVLLFGNVARGFKSGGFNGRPQQRPALDAFDPETVLSTEVGFKADWLDHRLRLNGTAFHSNYDDIHFAASLDVGGMPVFVTQNAGDAEISGFELEFQASPTPTLLWTTSVGYLDTEIVRVDPRVPADTVRVGHRLPKSPEWSFAVGLQSSHELADRGALVARVDYTWKDDLFQDFANVGTIAQDAFGLLGLRCLYAPTAGAWNVALFGTNLTDESYLESGFNTGAFGLDIGVAARPREWGLEATWRF